MANKANTSKGNKGANKGMSAPATVEPANKMDSIASDDGSPTIEESHPERNGGGTLQPSDAQRAKEEAAERYRAAKARFLAATESERLVLLTEHRANDSIEYNGYRDALEEDVKSVVSTLRTHAKRAERLFPKLVNHAVTAFALIESSGKNSKVEVGDVRTLINGWIGADDKVNRGTVATLLGDAIKGAELVFMQRKGRRDTTFEVRPFYVSKFYATVDDFRAAHPNVPVEKIEWELSFDLAVRQSVYKVTTGGREVEQRIDPGSFVFAGRAEVSVMYDFFVTGKVESFNADGTPNRKTDTAPADQNNGESGTGAEGQRVPSIADASVTQLADAIASRLAKSGMTEDGNLSKAGVSMVGQTLDDIINATPPEAIIVMLEKLAGIMTTPDAAAALHDMPAGRNVLHKLRSAIDGILGADYDAFAAAFDNDDSDDDSDDDADSLRRELGIGAAATGTDG